jgi:hypothetical protein
MNLLSKLFNFIIHTTKKYSIDESHGLSHSMNVLNYAYNIYNEELKKNKNYPNMDAVYSTKCFFLRDFSGKEKKKIQGKIIEEMGKLGIPYTISIGSSISVLRMGGKSKHKRKTTNKTTKKHRKTSKQLRKTK